MTNANTIILDIKRNLYWKQNKRGYVTIDSPELGYFTEEQAKEILQSNAYETADHKQVALNAYCIDFTTSHPTHGGGYVMIFAENVMQARDAMFNKHGKQWNFCYTKSEFYSRFPPNMGLIDIIAPVFEKELEK
ncbi:hypothetical protein [Cysteiniphilum halobium]|uniref:hypothetical protein n=1 Tax=Cysteiniphilum halobium TaxID=2219059 RepID=UPI000E65C622|nr:hypothetical protein [Cysteiniphilum halobium]